MEQRILAASSLKTLDDLYLPYRPKKQTLATLARQRGLEPLAMDVLGGQLPSDPRALTARCEELLDAEKQLHSEADVLTGVRHILAEVFSERVDLRSIARKCLWNGTLVCKRIERAEGDEGDSESDDDDYHDAEQSDSEQADFGNADTELDDAELIDADVEGRADDGGADDGGADDGALTMAALTMAAYGRRRPSRGTPRVRTSRCCCKRLPRRGRSRRTTRLGRNCLRMSLRWIRLKT